MAEVSAPASSGNLGPGFDVIGLALELRCSVAAHISDQWSARHEGPELLEPGAEDVVLAAARTISPKQALALTVRNHIPLGRGLGSSSAAAAAGAAAAMMAIEGVLDRERVCQLVTEFEGHADNAAATVYGGLVGVTPDLRHVSLEMHPSWRFVVGVPEEVLPTSEARRVLRSEIPRPAVVRNLGRLIALTEGLRTGSADLLGKAAGDELHESCRAELHPAAASVIDAALAAGAAHACWSGAGPSVLAVVQDAKLTAVAEALAGATAESANVLVLPVAATGLIAQ